MPALELIAQWQQDGTLAEAHQLAADLARRLGEPPPAASVVSVPVADADAVLALLGAAGIKAGAPAGRIRMAPHVYNTPSEIDQVVALLEPHILQLRDRAT